MRHRSNMDNTNDGYPSDPDHEMDPESRGITLGTAAVARSNVSDPGAIKDLFSKAGKKLYFQHIPQTKGVRLTVKYAGDDAPESD